MSNPIRKALTSNIPQSPTPLIDSESINTVTGTFRRFVEISKNKLNHASLCGHISNHPKSICLIAAIATIGTIVLLKKTLTSSSTENLEETLPPLAEQMYQVEDLKESYVDLDIQQKESDADLKEIKTIQTNSSSIPDIERGDDYPTLVILQTLSEDSIFSKLWDKQIYEGFFWNVTSRNSITLNIINFIHDVFPPNLAYTMTKIEIDRDGNNCFWNGIQYTTIDALEDAVHRNLIDPMGNKNGLPPKLHDTVVKTFEWIQPNPSTSQTLVYPQFIEQSRNRKLLECFDILFKPNCNDRLYSLHTALLHKCPEGHL